MPNIVFLDLEVDEDKNIIEIACFCDHSNFYYGKSEKTAIAFLKTADFIVGHNIIHHDLAILKANNPDFSWEKDKVIDTLYLSPLLFPKVPYHKLVKDDKLIVDEPNDALRDSKKAKELWDDEWGEFCALDIKLKFIFAKLLARNSAFKGFFRFAQIPPNEVDIEIQINDYFDSKICQNANLSDLIQQVPATLAYALALINANDKNSITPPWLVHRFPKINLVIQRLRNQPCLVGCSFCDERLDVRKGLFNFFGFNEFRSYNGQPLQFNAASAAINGKSLLAVFPTGGGKSITFQVPSLINGRNGNGLTVIISPLQSLMKDQVDNLHRKGITEAVALNGLLDPIERANVIERVENGQATLLYISPESLRSSVVRRMLEKRNVVRFVIDEAHCFSSWGHDFRVDYLYIGTFIKKLQESKFYQSDIPISCFTATAKTEVIEDIRNYFKDKLGIDLQTFIASSKRENLSYQVIETANDEDKFQVLRDKLTQYNCPTIVYVARTKKSEKLAARLSEFGFNAMAFHGKLESKVKTKIQQDFIEGQIDVMVATSAFGMGVDKSDVGLVVHFDISDSIENYMQEAGRAGRDENMKANCVILFNDDDLNKHFTMLNQMRLSHDEIKNVWKAIVSLTKYRKQIAVSALELGRKAGLDTTLQEAETKIKAIISTLETEGFLKRTQNLPKIYATGLRQKSALEALPLIKAAQGISEKERMTLERVVKSLFSSRNKKKPKEDLAEDRIDYLSDRLELTNEAVINAIQQLRELGILNDQRDLSMSILREGTSNKSSKKVQKMIALEKAMIDELVEGEQIVELKKWVEKINLSRSKDKFDLQEFITIFNFWSIRGILKRERISSSMNTWKVDLLVPKSDLYESLNRRKDLTQQLVKILFDLSTTSVGAGEIESDKEEVNVDFSVLEMKQKVTENEGLFRTKVAIPEIEESLLYLSKIEALKIDGGFLVLYNRLSIERLSDAPHNYNKTHYKNLEKFYENKTRQIHVVGEFARRMMSGQLNALQLADDYFRLKQEKFLNNYFPKTQNDLTKGITKKRKDKLFGGLSESQTQIINSEEKFMLILAGPGSGKTKVLVHKLAALLTLENVRQEQLLMLTFSRSAASEFRMRLNQLIGNVRFLEINTFHAYAFHLLGKTGNLEESENAIRLATQKIEDENVELNLIQKSVLVIDEAQDMSADEYSFLKALMKFNPEMRVILVGDDDQLIYQFRGAKSEYMQKFKEENQLTENQIFELTQNFRSNKSLVNFTQLFAEHFLINRQKNQPIFSKIDDAAEISITKYQSSNFIQPFVSAILNKNLNGTIGILTFTNSSSLQVYNQLKLNGLSPKLINESSGFRLYDIYEFQVFFGKLLLDDSVATIPDDTWKNALNHCEKHFGQNAQWRKVAFFIENFEKEFPKTRYLHDLILFSKELEIDDFQKFTGTNHIVCTLHKSKGKEFDHVFILWETENVNLNDEQNSRLLYVGLTRAKTNIYLHHNEPKLSILNDFSTYFQEDNQPYLKLNSYVLRFDYEDLYLSNFVGKEEVSKVIHVGNALQINTVGILINEQIFYRFSEKGRKKLEDCLRLGFKIKEASVYSRVVWSYASEQFEGAPKDRDTILLMPEIVVER